MEAHWLDYWLQRSRWHRAAGHVDGAAYSLERAERALGASPADFRQREVDLLKAEIRLDAGDAAGAEALLKVVAAGAEGEGHLPILWWARAAGTAAAAVTGSTAGEDVAPEAPPEALIGEHIPLALATFWYHARTHATAGRAMTAKLTTREGLALAREHGYAQWVRRFEALPS